jgi:hypothetical protein
MVFEREDKKKDDKKKKKPEKRNLDYKLYCEFQSHEPEFDYLKSLEIEEKINKIQWLVPQNNAQFLLSTNGIFVFDFCFITIFFFCVGIDKTIKLWKVYEKKIKTVTQWNADKEKEPKSSKDLIIPSMVKKQLYFLFSRKLFRFSFFLSTYFFFFFLFFSKKIISFCFFLFISYFFFFFFFSLF